MGDALAAFARPRMLSCAARALGISVIAYFRIPTIPQCAAQAAPVPRFAFQTYAKFAGDNSAMERAAKARERASWLKSLLAELEAE